MKLINLLFASSLANFDKRNGCISEGLSIVMVKNMKFDNIAGGVLEKLQ